MTAPAIYLAYRISKWLHYGESPGRTHEVLIDADTDQHRLVRRVNEHFAKEETIRFERGIELKIEPFRMRSQERYCPGGGGTDYNVHLEIRRAPCVTDTPQEAAAKRQ